MMNLHFGYYPVSSEAEIFSQLASKPSPLKEASYNCKMLQTRSLHVPTSSICSCILLIQFVKQWFLDKPLAFRESRDHSAGFIHPAVVFSIFKPPAFPQSLLEERRLHTALAQSPSLPDLPAREREFFRRQQD